VVHRLDLRSAQRAAVNLRLVDQPVEVAVTFDKTKPLLAAQSIGIRIEANAELAAEVLREMDLAALEKLLR
jgi:hypothetical protein